MTEGSPFCHIIRFMLPLLFGLLFQKFYNMVDAAIVGKNIGVDALAGVGSTGSLNFLILGFVSGVCYGFSLPIAQCFGAKDYAGLKKFVVNIFWLSIIFSVIITGVACALCRTILMAMSTPEDVYQYAYDYIIIIFAGIPATFLYNTLANMMSALGDSTRPLVYVIIASVTNIALDLLFIRVFRMGVCGAAYATVISQLFSGILCLLYIIKNIETLHVTKDDLKPSSYYIKNLCVNGIPMGLQYSITAIGIVLLQSSVNVLGSDYVASVTVGDKLGAFFISPFEALGSTMATYTGQNVGARKYNRVYRGMLHSLIIGIIYCVFAFVLLYFISDKLLLLFMDADKTQIIVNARRYLIVYSACFIFLLLVDTFRFSIQGMGFAGFAVIAGVVEMCARGAVALWVIPNYGFTAVCFTSPCAWVAADVFLLPAFFLCLKHLKNKQSCTPVKLKNAAYSKM